MTLHTDLTTILTCAQSELEAAGRTVPDEVYVAPGLIAFDLCYPQLWARVIRAFPSTSFPDQTTDFGQCNTDIAVQIGLGINRCQTGMQRLEQPAGHPLPTEQDGDAAGLVCDMGALLRALVCCYPTTDHAKDLIVDEWNQLEPQGGTIGGEWTAVIVGDLYCETTSPPDSPGESPGESPGDSP